MNPSDLEASPSLSEGEVQNLVSSPSPSSKMQNMGFGYATANPKSYSLMKQMGDEMKKHPTEAEDLLWNKLKNKATGHKIRRQHIIHNFIADFVCLRKKVVIEVDGKIHDQQKERDNIRTDILNQLGYEVIRFTNQEIMNNVTSVTQRIKDYLDQKS